MTRNAKLGTQHWIYGQLHNSLSGYYEQVEFRFYKDHPEEFGKAIAKNLGSKKTMRRMTAYLYTAKPRSAEEIADEMLAIMSDRKRWIQKKEAEEANARYNELLYYGLGEDEEGDYER